MQALATLMVAAIAAWAVTSQVRDHAHAFTRRLIRKDRARRALPCAMLTASARACRFAPEVTAQGGVLAGRRLLRDQHH